MKSFDPFAIPSLPEKPYNQFGYAKIITRQNYPSIKGMTVYYIEIFQESMRTIHVHGDCDEIGYVLEGKIQVFLYTPKKIIFTVCQGGSWFIPRGILHSLNNVGHCNARLFVGFNSDMPSNYDIKKIMGFSEINPLFSFLGKNQYNDRGNATPFTDKPNYWNPAPHFSIHKIVLDKKKSSKIFWFSDSAIFYVNIGKSCVIKVFDKNIIIERLHYYFVEMGKPHSFVINETIELLMFYTGQKRRLELNINNINYQLLKNCLK